MAQIDVHVKSPEDTQDLRKPLPAWFTWILAIDAQDIFLYGLVVGFSCIILWQYPWGQWLIGMVILLMGTVLLCLLGLAVSLWLKKHG